MALSLVLTGPCSSPHPSLQPATKPDGQASWSFVPPGADCPRQHQAKETDCLEAVQAAAAAAGMGEIYGYKVIEEHDVPPGCSYSPFSEAALFNRDSSGLNENEWQQQYKPVCRSEGTRRMDVLMLAIDDLRAQLRCSEPKQRLQHPTMSTPHLCALAGDSLMLQRSHVTMATCGPSRTSLLTSRHPSTTRVWDQSQYWRNISGNFTTIPQYFKEEGYLTAGMGKLFHDGPASGATDATNYPFPCGTCRGSDDADYSWTEPYFRPHHPVAFRGKEHSWIAVPAGSVSPDGQPLEDDQIRDHAVTTLEQIARRRQDGSDTRAFFVAVGFHKPHLPWIFPERFLDEYPPESEIELPSNPWPSEGMPNVAWQLFPETRGYDDIKALHVTGRMGKMAYGMPDDKTKELRRAYYAAVSYADFNCGAVLDALSQNGLRESTVVVVWSDHGWSLGEHGLWDKVKRRRLEPMAGCAPVSHWAAHLGPVPLWQHTNFDINTLAPLFFHVPGVTDGGISTDQLTSTVDIFPTVVELVFGRTLPTCAKSSSHETQLCTEGTSLVPLIHDPGSEIKLAAYSEFPRVLTELLEDAEAVLAEAKSDVNARRDEIAAAKAAVKRLRGALPATQQDRLRKDPSVDEDPFYGIRGGASPCLDYDGDGAGCIVGYSMQTRVSGHEFRFTEWVRFKGPSANWAPDWDGVYGLELYNHTSDVAENVNLLPGAERREAKLLSELRARLHNGWRHNFATVDHL